MAGKRAKNSGQKPLASEALRLTLSNRESQTNRKREIATALYSVARKLGWTVGKFHWDVIARSYHWVDIEHGDKRFIVAFEHGSRVVALAEHTDPTSSLLLDFFDDPAFVEAVRDLSAPFIVLSSVDLQNYPTDADREFIAEHPGVYWPDDVSYYRPRSVGEIIFNWWD